MGDEAVKVKGRRGRDKGYSSSKRKERLYRRRRRGGGGGRQLWRRRRRRRKKKGEVMEEMSGILIGVQVYLQEPIQPQTHTVTLIKHHLTVCKCVCL